MSSSPPFSPTSPPVPPLRLFATGLAMGVADLIPGVSGGTIAFVAGIYADLLAAIRAFDSAFFASVFRLRFRAAFERIPWRFLVLLVSGIATAIVALSRVFSWALAEHQGVVFAFFFGLVAASIVAVGGTLRWRWPPLLAGVVGAATGLAIVSVVPAAMPHDPLTLFWSGGVAILAMILPGISGSFILLILGQYEFLLGAVVDGDVVSILFAAAGAFVGLAVFARLLGWLLTVHRAVTVATLVGVMAGTLRRLWPFEAQATLADGVLLVAAMAAGFATLTLFDHWRTGANPVARALRLGARTG